MDIIGSELNSLTEREREVLRLLSNGHDIKSIARELSVSPSAVTDRLRHARRKLGVSTSREAARLFSDSNPEPRIGVHTFSGETNPSDLRQQRLTKIFAGFGIAMVIMIAAAATLFSLIDGVVKFEDKGLKGKFISVYAEGAAELGVPQTAVAA